MSFSPQAIKDFRTELLFELLTDAKRTILPAIPSKRLRARLEVRVNTSGLKGDLFLPQFWAVIHHDGRRGFGPRDAKFLVFFVNPANDPRQPTPDRAADQRRLSRKEFEDALFKNKSMQKTNPAGGSMQHMIIVKTPDGKPARVGPASGSFFFTGEAARRFESKVDDLVFSKLDAFIKSQIVHEDSTARGVIRL